MAEFGNYPTVSGIILWKLEQIVQILDDGVQTLEWLSNWEGCAEGGKCNLHSLLA
jgi:hypothetical protein